MLNIPNKTTKQVGFTLVEIMVAVSVFTIVVIVGIGALLTVNAAYRKTKDRRQAVASVSNAVEYMVREMRTGYSFVCTNYENTVLTSGTPILSADCFPPVAPSDGITFLDQEGNQQMIYFNPSVVGYQGIGQILKTSFSGGITQQPQPVTDPSIVDIESVNFYVKGVSDSTHTIQPFILVQIKGSVVGQANSDFTFQSAISQRLLDVQ